MHSPYPPRTGPSLGIYLFGDLLNAIVSQIPHHPDNPRKIVNSESYPEFHSLEKLLSYEEDDRLESSHSFATLALRMWTIRLCSSINPT